MSTRGFWSRTRPGSASAERADRGATRLKGVTIPCRNFAVAREFYVDLLGLKIVGRGRNHLLLQAGPVKVVLLDAVKVQGYNRGDGQSFYLELAVPDLAGLKRRLEQHRMRVFQPRKEGNTRLLTAQDPEGNLVNLVEIDERRAEQP